MHLPTCNFKISNRSWLVDDNTGGAHIWSIRAPVFGTEGQVKTVFDFVNSAQWEWPRPGLGSLSMEERLGEAVGGEMSIFGRGLLYQWEKFQLHLMWM